MVYDFENAKSDMGCPNRKKQQFDLQEGAADNFLVCTLHEIKQMSIQCQIKLQLWHTMAQSIPTLHSNDYALRRTKAAVEGSCRALLQDVLVRLQPCHLLELTRSLLYR